MNTPMPLWISEAVVVSLMDMAGAISALENGLLAENHGDAQNMVKTHVEWSGGGTLHAIGATFPKWGFTGTKTWSHTTGGATPILVLFDSNNGALKAIIEAFALGQMRTAAASGVATRWLASPEAEEIAIIGTGKQAMAQVAAVLAVRPIRRIRVFSPTKEHRQGFATRVRNELETEALPLSSIEEAVKDVPVITLATRATEPFLKAGMIARGTHINAIGAIIPSRAEITSDVVGRSTRIVVDSVPQAQKLSRELIQAFDNETKWASVLPLSRVVAERCLRSPFDDLTLFKSLGMGISDLSLGIYLYKKAVELGLGREFSHPQKTAPRLMRPQTLSAT